MAFIVPNQTSFIQERPYFTGTTWTRPVDWITITDTTGEVQFLVSDITIPSYRINTTFTRTGGVGNIYIDWGDGVIDTITTTTATDTSHTYTGGGTPSTQGYNTWKIRIYGDAGTQITTAYQLVPAPFFNSPNNPLGGTLVQVVSGLLEAYYGNNTITSAVFLFSYSIVRPLFYNLRYVKLPAVMNGAGNILENAFGACRLLSQVVLPTSMPNNTSTRDLFAGCISLQSVVFPQDMINLTDFVNTFSNCNNLTSVVLPPSMNNVPSLQGAFSGCFMLPDIDFLPPLPNCSSFNQAFSSCRSIITANLKTMKTTGQIDFTAAFAGNYSLEYVILPAFQPGQTSLFATTFSTCPMLKTFTSPPNFNPINMNACFNGCSSLTNVSLPSSCPNLADLQNTFASCFALSQVDLPTTIAASAIPIQGIFTNCYSMTDITIPSSYTISNYQVAFQSCFSLQRITLPSSFNGAFFQNVFNGCGQLREIIIPAPSPTTQNMTGTFASTASLQTLNMSAYTATTITTISGLFNTSGIKSVVMPPTMGGLQIGTNAFANCLTLEDLVMPTSVAANFSSFQGLCQNNYSIRNVVLPTTQTTSVSSCNSMFLNNFALTGITNLDKIGNPSTAATTYIDGTSMFQNTYNLTTIDLYCKFSKFDAHSSLTTLKTALTSLRLRNNGAGQYGGTSPQINISYTNLSQAALVQVFNDLPTITAKTINITGASGAAALTPAERAIATGKGWTIVG